MLVFHQKCLNTLSVSLFLLLLAGQAFAQSNNEAIHQELTKLKPQMSAAISAAKSTKSLLPVSLFVDTVSLEFPENRNFLRQRKIDYMQTAYARKVKNLPKEQRMNSPEAQEMMAEYDKIIAQCSNCAQIYTYASAVKSLRKFGIETDKNNPKYKAIKASGYKFERTGVGIGPVVMYGKDLWVGGEISLLRTISPSYRIVEKDSITGKVNYSCSHKTSFAASAFSVAYAVNLQEKVNDFSFNLMSITAPMLMKITQFGVQSAGYFAEKSQWYYRPEIGIGFGAFSLGASYTWMFTPTGRKHGEKWMVTASFNYPL